MAIASRTSSTVFASSGPAFFKAMPSCSSERLALSDVPVILEGETGDEIWSLMILAARLQESNAQAAASAEPAFLAKYTFNLARAFNLFYHRHRIIGEENEVKRAVLIAVADFTRRQLTTALATLGIEVPERM